MTNPESQMSRAGAELSASRPVAAFDFDGTLTVRDCFRAFLRWRGGAADYWGGMLRMAPAGLVFLLDGDRTKLKAAMVKTWLAGLPRAALDEEAAAFAAVAAPRLFRPDALDVWRRHQAEGALMVIVTASPEPVVAPFARALGADLLIGTRLAYDAGDRVAGGLDGLNCRGPEKVVRLRKVLGDGVRLTAAYGDTAGDREMLALADAGFMRLFTARPAPDGG